MAISGKQAANNAEAFTAMFKHVYETGAKVEPIDDDYNFILEKRAVNSWYFGSQCRSCSGDAAFFLDPSGGKMENILTGPFRLHVECPHCYLTVSSAAPALRSFQWSGDR